MTNESRGIEWKVGIFMLIGLGVIAFMAIKFGKLSQGLKNYYNITAEFPNASGLLKGADVYMAGARVGFTADAPELIDGRYAVQVLLKLKEGVKIPRGSSFLISSSGFLGDAFVSINPPENPNLNDILKDGENVKGTRLQGLGDLTEKGGDVMDELKKRLKELESPIKDIRERVLAEKNLKAIDETFASLSDISSSLKNTTKGLDEVVSKAKEAADTIKDTVSAAKNPIEKMDGVVQKIDSAAGDLKATLAEIKNAAGTADKALGSAKTLIEKANSGKGALGMLLADKETADNLKALIRNLREHGVLWYKNKAQ
jgi:phospholipid/cholesterol/gamma-HCH transport system substrate-binding protein